MSNKIEVKNLYPNLDEIQIKVGENEINVWIDLDGKVIVDVNDDQYVVGEPSPGEEF